ncbi:hypothetical protein D3C84_747800 [compost metagenome]
MADSLQNALEHLDGPIVAKASLRKELSAQWAALTSSASAASGPLLSSWLQDTATSLPLLKRLGRDPTHAGQLLTAVDRLGANSAPLVCTDGMPAAAQRILLDQLSSAGAQLYYHGDYDWPGIGIDNHVMRTWQAVPWRFGCNDYLEAMRVAPTRPRDLDTFGIEALWDKELRAAMDNQGIAIPEEAVAGTLQGDLSHGKKSFDHQ